MPGTVKHRIAKWNTDTRFNFGTPSFTNVVVVGVDSAASLQLTKFTDNSDDITFTTPGNYIFNGAEIEVIGGIAKLVQSSGLTKDYPFTTPANYTFDSGKISISGDSAQLIGASIAPYAWWHMNESMGSNMSDSSGNGRDGTLVNMENADWVAAKLNNGLIFDGVDEYVNCGDIANFERTQKFSVEAWVKFTSSSAIAVASRNVIGAAGWITYANTGKFLLYLSDSTGSKRVIAETTATYNDGVWHHLVITYRGNSLYNGVVIYIDGSPVSTTSLADNLDASIIGLADCYIGGRDGGTLLWNGTLDEVVIYDRELTFTAVSDRYNSGTGIETMPADKPSLYGWWHLNESTGSNAADSSGNSRDGTLMNMENADWVAAKLNNGLVFDGVNEYVTMGDVAAFERFTPFSIECWLNTTATTLGMIATRMQAGAPNRGWQFYKRNPDGKIRLDLANDFGTLNVIRVRNDVDLNDGVWHHVIVTYNGSSTAAGVKIYVDGSSVSKIEELDDLTATMVPTSVDLNIAAREAGNTFDGTLDEVIIYDQELTATDVTARYNSGSGTEVMPGSFPTDDPTIVYDTGEAFTSAIIDFTETATIPAGSGIKYHVSNDGGVIWKYWTGSTWAVTDNTYTQANVAADIDTNISTLAASGTFKFRAVLHSDTGAQTPVLDNLHIEGALTYTVGDFEIEMNTDIDPATVFEWLTITEIVTKPINTNIKYKHSEDSGGSYNALWLTAEALQTALQGIATPDKIRFKFQLSTTDTNVTPEIDNLNITSLTGYESNGVYESISYTPDTSISMQGVSFTVTTPSGTTAVIEVRVCEHILEDSWNIVNSGENVRLAGDYIKWRITMEGDGTKTPVLDDIQIVFYALSALRAWNNV